MTCAVTIKRVNLGEHQVGVTIETGRYTDIFVRLDGQCYYSRVPGWDTVDSDVMQAALFDQRRKSYSRR